jgi:hypothetical protein
MKPQAKESDGVQSGERGAQCCGLTLRIHMFPKGVIQVVNYLNMIRSFLKFKMQNSPKSPPWYVKLVT